MVGKLNSFEPGLIHQPKFFRFWQETLQSPPWILEIIQHGYALPLKEWPPAYEERNNKSARDNSQVIRSIMADMIQMGVVKVVKEKPHIVSPLGLVTKIQDDGSVKNRLVYDASRHLNGYLETPHVKLSHLDKALEITQQGDFQGTFDLTSAYYHIKIREDHQTLLGAAFHNSDGSVVYVQYTCLPFGVSTAVHIITKIWKPISQYLNRLGIRNTVYIDDGRILARNAQEMIENRKRTYDVISQAGWAIEESKSDTLEDQQKVKKYLGFLICSDSMMVSASDKKLVKVGNLIKHVLSLSKVPIKVLAALMGNVIALEPSHGMLARVTTRTGYVTLAEHTETEGWRGSAMVSETMRKELQFLLDNLQSCNGSPIKNKMFEIRIDSIVPAPLSKVQTIPNHHQKQQEVFVSDSSEFKTFVYNLKDGDKVELTGNFNDDQKMWSSSARELLAILWTFRQWQHNQSMHDKSIYWMTDSENVVRFIKKGSRQPIIQEIIFEIVTLAFAMKIHLEPVHLLRQDPRIQLADEGSKRLDTDNWSIDDASFLELTAIIQPQIDLFADAQNKKCHQFCSLYYQEGTTAVDAFTIPWFGLGTLWICPPVGQLIRTHARILTTPCEGIIVLPIWRTANYFSLFFDNCDMPKPPFTCVKRWSPYVVQNEGARNTALFGRVHFEFAALIFKTN